jgi:hypothetical protein
MPLGTPYEKMAIPVGRRYGAIFKWARSLTSRANVTGPSMNTSWHFRRKITQDAQSKRLSTFLTSHILNRDENILR